MRDERWIILVHERPAAVERVLGTLRRRAVDVSDLSVARASTSSLVVNVAVRVAGHVGARVTAELKSSPDTLSVERTGDHLTTAAARAEDLEDMDERTINDERGDQ